MTSPQGSCFPAPTAWARVHKALRKYSEVNTCNPPNPPAPLILAGWSFSTEKQKVERWMEFKLWAESNGCLELINLDPSDLNFPD